MPENMGYCPIQRQSVDTSYAFSSSAVIAASTYSTPKIPLIYLEKPLHNMPKYGKLSVQLNF